MARRTCFGRVAMGAVSAALGAALCLGQVPASAFAADAQSTFEDALAEVGKSADDVPKSELVYGVADWTGAPQALFVLDGGAASGESGLSEGVSSADLLDALEGSPLLYEGDLASEFPWRVTVGYWLDGIEVLDAKSLRGATGNLRIEVSVEPAGEGSLGADYADAYFLQVAGSFDPARFAVADAGGLSSETSGGVTTLSGLVMPGESAAWTIAGAAEDFESYGWQLSAMRFAADVDLRDYDLSELTEAADELASATGQLAQGGAALTLALDQASAVSAQLGAGASALATGAVELTAGIGQLGEGAAALVDGVGQMDELQSTLVDADAVLTRLQTRVSDMEENLAGLRASVGDDSALLALIDKAMTDGQGLSKSLGEVKAQMEAIDAAFADGESQARSASSSAEGAVSEIDAAAAAFEGLVAEKGLADDSATAEVRTALAAARGHAVDANASAKASATSVATARASYQVLLQDIDWACVKALADDVDAIVAEVGTLASAGDGAAESVSAAIGDARELAGQTSEGIAELQAGASALRDGIDAAGDGTSQLAGIAQLMATGNTALSSGLGQAAGGSATLTSGLDVLAATFDGLDQEIIDEAQATIDEKLGSGWEPRSFADPSDTSVASVTFVLVVDGIN